MNELPMYIECINCKTLVALNPTVWKPYVESLMRGDIKTIELYHTECMKYQTVMANDMCWEDGSHYTTKW